MVFEPQAFLLNGTLQFFMKHHIFFYKFFYRLLWQVGDNGKVKGLVNGLDKSSLIRGISERKEDLKENKKLLALIENFSKTRGTHGFWACKSILLKLFFIQ